MEPLKAGIIGLGVGEQHIAGYEKHPACEVVCLCDFAEEKRRKIQEKYPEKCLYKSDKELLARDDVHIISVASFDNHHYDQIMGALETDKHVFVEKPLCLYEDQARAIRYVLRKKPHLKMSSNLILRKSERFINLKRRIDTGQLGRLYHVEGDYNYGRIHKITEGWRGQIPFYSVVYGGGVHIVDLLLWLTGDIVVEVSAYGNNISTRDSQYQYDDMIVAILKFKSGMTGKIASNYSCVFPHFHSLNLYGTQATFVNGQDAALLYTSRDSTMSPEEIRLPYPGVHKGDLLYSFVEAICTGGKPDVDDDDVFRTMSVCFAIEKAVQTGQSVKVDYI